MTMQKRGIVLQATMTAVEEEACDSRQTQRLTNRCSAVECAACTTPDVHSVLSRLQDYANRLACLRNVPVKCQAADSIRA